MRKQFAAALIIAAFCAPVFAGEAGGFIPGHITTCHAFINGYPADTTNWFFRAQHKVVQYWAYFLFPSGKEIAAAKSKNYLFINPYELYSGAGKFKDENNYVFENRWISPSGKTIAEKVYSWNKTSATDKITIDNRNYVSYAFINYVGIAQMFKENGQERLPDEVGLYHINLYINGELAAVTFFEMKD